MKMLPKGQWCVYMLRCGDNSLYTGITNHLEARVLAHQAGKGAKYTRSHLPVELVYYEPSKNRSEASQREAELKKIPREEKQNLIFQSPS